MTPRMANELVIKLADILNLDEVLTFELLEAYFLTNDQTKKLLIYLETLDINISNGEAQMPQPNTILNM